MSRILPDPIVGQFAPEVIEVYRSLRAIPDEELSVWVSLPLPGSETRPHFLAVVRERMAFLIAVSGAGQADVEEASGESLFPRRTDIEPPGKREAGLLRTFFFNALTRSESGDSGGAVTGLVLFPNVSQAAIDRLASGSRPGDVFFLGRETCKPAALSAFFASEMPPELNLDAVALLRSAYSPESVVPAHFSPSGCLRRNLEASLAPMLLDFDQEQWATHRLVLSPEAGRLAEEPNSYGGASLVTGVAGSGKSLVLLFRACTQARLAPATTSLVLTHNRALKIELESRFGELGRPVNVRWHTFYSWIHHLLTGKRQFPKIVQYSERDSRIAAAARAHWGVLEQAQVAFLASEFDWMQDRGIVGRDEYLAAERGGRGVRLGESARRKVFESFVSYRSELSRDGAEDWSGVALLTWQLVQSGELPLPLFDFIYIDEAQFFAPVWFRLIRAALRPSTGCIHLAADPTQGFLKRRQSWSACGLDLRGRSTKLRRSYRSTREILEFAAGFYLARVDDDELPDLNLPGEEELAAAPRGSNPQLLVFTSRQDEMGRVANEISACLEEGCRPEHLLVLVAGEGRFAQVFGVLESALGAHRVADARDSTDCGRVRVCGINAATGLESPVVFVVGVSDLLAAEQNFQLKDEARSELVRDNTRRLYMAFTRAGQRLVITWSGPDLPCCLEGIGR